MGILTKTQQITGDTNKALKVLGADFGCGLSIDRPRKDFLFLSVFRLIRAEQKLVHISSEERLP